MSEVEVDICDRVATVVLNAPRRRNALTLEMSAEIEAAFDAVEADPGVGAVVVAANGPSFCAGADRAVLAAVDEAGLRQIYRAFLRVRESPLPTVCAVGGPAVGAGCNLALAGDVRVVGRSARFDTRFLRLGVHCGGGHTRMLNSATGYGAAAAMLLFGETVDGLQAERIGLAWTCVDDDDLLSTAQQLAATAAAFDRDLVVACKDSLRQATTSITDAEVVELELSRQLSSMRRAR